MITGKLINPRSTELEKAKSRLTMYLLEVQITFSLSQDETLAILSDLVISEIANKDIQ